MILLIRNNAHHNNITDVSQAINNQHNKDLQIYNNLNNKIQTAIILQLIYNDFQLITAFTNRKIYNDYN